MSMTATVSGMRQTTLARQLKVTTAIGLLTLALSQPALAGPKGGNVVGGRVTIEQKGTTTNIRQKSRRGIIEWRNFDIKKNETVNFQQPSRHASTLNRVKSDQVTTIKGALNANGNVYIVNPNGVLINKDAQVNVGGLVATSADITNQNFMSGNDRFDIPGNPDAAIVNEGRITFGDAGLVGLVGPNAANEGVIAGKVGKVVVAGTDAFAIDMAGDGIIALPTGGADVLSATNDGEILNPGGHVLIDAATAEGVLESTVDVGGTIEATHFAAKDGKITLSGSHVEVSGTLDVTGREGGEIDVIGETIALRDGAELDASGRRGGGSIKVGGDRAGEAIGVASSDRDTARVVLAESGATLKADAIDNGDGGEVILFAEQKTGFFGEITARGGRFSGDGGFAETSADFVIAEGMADLSAPHGESGLFLIDPDIINIEESFDGYFSNTLAPGETGQDIFFDDPGDNEGDVTTIHPDFITSVDGNLLLQAVTAINVNETVDNSATGNTLDLTLQAGRGVNVNADLLINGSITIDTGVDTGSQPGLTGFNGIRVDDGVTLGTDGTLGLNVAEGQRVALDPGSMLQSGGGLVLPTTVISGLVTLDVTGGTISQTGELQDGAFQFEADTGILNINANGNDIQLASVENDVNTVFFAGDNVDYLHADTGANLTITGLDTTGDVVVESGGGIRLTAGDQNFNDQDILVGGDLSLRGEGAIFNDFFTGFSVSGVTLFEALEQGEGTDFFTVGINGPVNNFEGGVSFAGGFVFIDGIDLTVEDGFAKDSVFLTATGGDLTVSEVFVLADDTGQGFADLNLLSNEGDITATDLVATVITTAGSDSEGGPLPSNGDVTIGRFQAETLEIVGASGTVTLTDGSIDTLTIDDEVGSLFLNSVDIIGPDTLTFDMIGPGGTLGLNGVRGAGTLTGVADRVELGFVEAGSLSFTVTEGIFRTPDADLPLGDGGDVTISAPDLAQVPLDDVTVDTGDDFDGLITTGSFNVGGSGEILLPSGDTGDGLAHNDVTGFFFVNGMFSRIVFEDANDLNFVTLGAAENFGAVTLRADADNSGDDGFLSASIRNSGDVTLLTGGDIEFFGATDGELQLVGNNAEVFPTGADLIISNSRLDGNLTVAFGAFSEGNFTADGTLAVFDSVIGGNLDIRNTDVEFFFDDEILAAQESAVTFAGAGNITLDRVLVQGNADLEAQNGIGLSDVQIDGNAFAAAPIVIAQRVAVQGSLDIAPGLNDVAEVELTDSDVGGSLTVEATDTIEANRVQVAGLADLSADMELSLSNAIFDGGTSLSSSVISIASSDFAGSLAFADGTDLSLTDVSIEDDLTTGLAGALVLTRVQTGGDLTASTDGVLDATDLHVDGGADFDADSYVLTRADIAGTAEFQSGAGVTLTDTAFGSLLLGTQTSITGNRVFASGTISGATTGAFVLSDLMAGGDVLLDAGTDLTLDGFLLASAELGAGGTLTLIDGLSTESIVTTPGVPATIFVTNVQGAEFDLTATGDLSFSGISYDLLTATSTGGDILIGEQASGTLVASAPMGVVEDGTAEGAFFDTGFSDFTVFGVGEINLPGAIDGLADITGPGDGTAVTIGDNASADLGDTVGDQRVLQTIEPVDGVAGADGLGGLGTIAARDDVLIVAPEPDQAIVPEIPEEPEVPEIPVEPEDPFDPRVVIDRFIGDLVDDEGEEDPVETLSGFFFEEPIFELPSPDFATLFSATGNENLWSRSQGDEEEEQAQ